MSTIHEDRMNKLVLKTAFREIEMLGDEDEASHKHILFGLTALCHLGSWNKRADYSTPGGNSTIAQITPHWDSIADVFYDVGIDKFREYLARTDYNCDHRLNLLKKI